MRVSRQTLAGHRTAMLDHAARLFRRRGVAPVAVADITRAAGLTHGAFYGHFTSKAALAAEALDSTLAESAARWRGKTARARAEGRDPIAALIDTYLSESHRDAPESGCALAALGSEMLREAGLHGAMASGIDALAGVLAQELALRWPQAEAASCDARALAILATMNGGLMLARALTHDPARSRTALQASAAMARDAAANPPD